jgi:hypothetical protein
MPASADNATEILFILELIVPSLRSVLVKEKIGSLADE